MDISLDNFSSFVALGVVHLEDKSAIFGVDLAGIESRAVISEAPPVTLEPPALIKRVEIVLPVKLELASLRVVRLHFHVVVASVPGHAGVVEVVTPACEGGRPEVHSQ